MTNIETINSSVVLTNGMKVAQLDFSGVLTGIKGEIEIRDGLPKVIFTVENSKKITAFKPERWQVIETSETKEKGAKSKGNGKGNGAKVETASEQSEQSETSANLSDILEVTEKKQANRENGSPAKVEISETLETMTDAEIALREKLESEFKAKQKKEKDLTAKIEKQVAELNQMPFELSRIAYELQSKKLYRSTHTSFKAYAVEVLKVTNAQYVFQLARVGNFAELQKDFIGENGLSFRAADSFINNSKALGAKFGQAESELSERNDYLTQVLEVTKAAGTNEKNVVKITPDVIAKTNDAIVEFLESQTIDTSGDIFAQAAAKLSANREKVVNNAKFNIENSGQLEVCSHNYTIRDITNDIITLDCGCTFKRFQA